MPLDLTPPENFVVAAKPTDVASRWINWKTRFQVYLDATGINNEGQKRSLLLHTAGEEVLDIATNNLGGDTSTVQLLTAALDDHFGAQANPRYERYEFRNMHQKQDQSIDGWYTTLRTKARGCDFGQFEESAVLDQIISGCQSQDFRRKLLQKKNITLDEALTLGRAMEASFAQAKNMDPNKAEDDDREVQVVSKRRKEPQWARKAREEARKTTGSKRQPPEKQLKPKCKNCGRFGHSTCTLAEGRNRKSASDTDGDTDSSDAATWVLNAKLGKSKDSRVYRTLSVNGKSAEFLVDSGSGANLLDEASLRYIGISRQALKPTKRRIFPYGSDTAHPVMGRIPLNVEWKGKDIRCNFLVVPGKSGSILGRDAAFSLGILYIDEINRISAAAQEEQLPECPDKKLLAVLRSYRKVFEGLGRVKGIEISLKLSKDAAPVVHPPSKVPVHLQEPVNRELDIQERLGIIEPVSGPTPWVARMVAAPKESEGEVRLTQDFRDINKFVIRERQPIPTVEEVTSDVAGATVFSKLDVYKAFHQIPLDENSRQYATFSTPRGLRRCTTLVMGFSSSSEILQRVMTQVLGGIPGVKWCHDDILVFGKGEAEHMQNLEKVLARLEEFNMTLNAKKCSIGAKCVSFFGFLIDKHGVRPKADKLQAVKSVTPPRSATEVRSFLGLANFLSPFVPNLANLSAPLRSLTKKGTRWVWSDVHAESFHRIKEAIGKHYHLVHFDMRRRTTVLVDASPVGLGAILCQNDPNRGLRPISCASRALTETEQRYSQIEREALAIRFACRRFRYYLLGDPGFDIITDHKPLLGVFKAGSRPTPRLERWALEIQEYNFTLSYSPGKGNVADYLSRRPEYSGKSNQHADVFFSSEIDLPKALSLKDVSTATDVDPVIQEVMRCIRTGCWDKCSPQVRRFRPLAKELHEGGGCLLRSGRVVIPETLRHTVLKLAHRGHQGMVRTKARLRAKVWWPGIGADAEDIVAGCRGCNMASPDGEVRQTPLRPNEIPKGPWTVLHIDFMGPFPTGESLLVIVDAYSKYPEVKVCKEMTSGKVIEVLEGVLRTFGVPEVLVSDNGPCFTSDVFRDFVRSMGVMHRRVIPGHPRSNSEVERMNRVIKKVVLAAIAEKRNWRDSLADWMVAYRNTPNETGASPVNLLFGRKGRDILPTFEPEESFDPRRAIERRREAKMEMKARWDAKRGVAGHSLKVGDKVVRRIPKPRKLQLPWSLETYDVVRIKGDAIFLRSDADGSTSLRHVTDVKKLK